MSWPTWIDELRDRYLDDAASAFLVVGDIHAEHWVVDGDRVDAANVLVRFLARTRPVVGVLRFGVAAGLRFPTYSDEKHFDELVEAAILLNHQALALSPREPVEAMGRIWQALTTHGTDQAYMVVDVDQMVPRRRRRVDPIPGAPGIFEWPTHATLRRSNNLVVFLASDEHAVREELVAACHVVRLEGPPSLSEAGEAALEHLEADVPVPVPPEAPVSAPAPAEAPPAPPPPSAVATGPVDWQAVRPHLETALVASLIAHPEEHRPARIPVIEAVGRAMMALGGPDVSDVRLGLDEEGQVVGEGSGADALLALWRSDIALDAAAGMLLAELPTGFSAAHPPDLDETAVRALSKRIAKKLKA